MYFSEDEIRRLNAELPKIIKDYEKTLLKYGLRQFKTEKSNEFVKQGFLRRLKTINHCILSIYEACPPENEEKLNSKDLLKVTVNIHAIIINIYGCLDNLARVWAEEKSIKNKDGSELRNHQIGFNKTQKLVWRSFPYAFKQYLEGRKGWLTHIEEFRHALAHRIPPYIPPYVSNEEEALIEKQLEAKRTDALQKHNFEEYERLSQEIESIGSFIPLLTHSFSEKSKQMFFHAQVISDWNTIIEISEKLFEEI